MFTLNTIAKTQQMSHWQTLQKYRDTINQSPLQYLDRTLNLFWEFNYSASSRITFQVYHQIHTNFRENRIRDKTLN